MTVAGRTGQDGETSTMTGDESSHIWPLTFLAEYVMVLQISELLWHMEQKKKGPLCYLWVHTKLVGNSRGLVPQS